MIRSTKPAQAPAEAYVRSYMTPASVPSLSARKALAFDQAKDRTTDFEYNEMLQQARNAPY